MKKSLLTVLLATGALISQGGRAEIATDLQKGLYDLAKSVDGMITSNDKQLMKSTYQSFSQDMEMLDIPKGRLPEETKQFVQSFLEKQMEKLVKTGQFDPLVKDGPYNAYSLQIDFSKLSDEDMRGILQTVSNVKFDPISEKRQYDPVCGEEQHQFIDKFDHVAKSYSTKILASQLRAIYDAKPKTTSIEVTAQGSLGGSQSTEQGNTVS